MRIPGRGLLGTVMVTALLVASAGVATSAGASPEPSPPTTASDDAPSTPGITGVVLIMADDLDWQTFMQVPRLAALRSQGMTFSDHVVTDSLCCPSRTSVFRAQFVHNHHVTSNIQATGGGWPTFARLGEQNDCLPTWLSAAGVRTAMIGKYLNEYPGRQPRLVPPGWSDWVVPTTHGYEGYNYTLNVNGHLAHHGSAPADYLNDVLDQHADRFLRSTTSPFYLELTPFAPHLPAPTAPRHRRTPGAPAPRTPNYGATGTAEPSWLAGIPAITPSRAARIDRTWRQRVRSAQSVADSVDTVMAALRATGRLDHTLVLVTSDNGFHAGNHRLSPGKRTAFREDSVVPLVVIGPDVRAGATVDAVTSTIDFGPTFTELLGAHAPDWVDGRSLAPLLHTATTPTDWRTATLTENDGLSRPGDPDYTVQSPPPYVAMRSRQWLLVTYASGEQELYDEVSDPYELVNVASTVAPDVVSALTEQSRALTACAGASCRTADALAQPSAS